MIKMIFCTDLHGAIGYNNDLLFTIREDLINFKRLTLGHKVIMGYNTWESLPKKPLPKRENIILTSRNIDVNGVEVIRDIESIIEISRYEDIFVIGGAQVYNELIERNLVDEVYLTMVLRTADVADRYVNIFKMSTNLQKRVFIQEFKSDDLVAHLYKYSRK